MGDRELQEIEEIVEESRKPMSLEGFTYDELYQDAIDNEYERAVVSGLVRGGPVSREIRFRAWDETGREGMVSNKEVLNIPGMAYMQFTGLRDRNGKDIYEGDVVSFTVFDFNDDDTQETGIVTFSSGEWEMWKSSENEFYGNDGAHHLFIIHSQDDEIEVIGNIYEHKHLGGLK